jgi:hypothetical protein
VVVGHLLQVWAVVLVVGHLDWEVGEDIIHGMVQVAAGVAVVGVFFLSTYCNPLCR